MRGCHSADTSISGRRTGISKLRSPRASVSPGENALPRLERGTSAIRSVLAATRIASG